jgi:hypothetical protein
VLRLLQIVPKVVSFSDGSLKLSLPPFSASSTFMALSASRGILTALCENYDPGVFWTVYPMLIYQVAIRKHTNMRSFSVGNSSLPRRFKESR